MYAFLTPVFTHCRFCHTHARTRAGSFFFFFFFFFFGFVIFGWPGCCLHVLSLLFFFFIFFFFLFFFFLLGILDFLFSYDFFSLPTPLFFFFFFFFFFFLPPLGLIIVVFFFFSPLSLTENTVALAHRMASYFRRMLVKIRNF